MDFRADPEILILGAGQGSFYDLNSTARSALKLENLYVC
jgi:hypothetical protein